MADNTGPIQPNEVKPAAYLRRGTLIENQYEIVDLLGVGGMGAVYKAKQLNIERFVAIKVLHPKYSADVSAVKRFQREARIISELRHPHILAIYTFRGTQDFLYLAMEFILGQSLGRYLHERGRLEPEVGIKLFAQICSAMSYAHRSGVLHRDLKPDNVMLVMQENKQLNPKVVDFGLAKLINATLSQRLTRTGEVVGDPRYMSPEQCRGEDLDARSDVYSFGCLMYEVLTGDTPFDGDDPVALMQKQISQDPAPFAKRLSLPQGLESITLTAMAKDRRDRYESFDSLLFAIEKFTASPDLKIVVPKSSAQIKRERQRTKRRSAALVACGLLIAGALCAWTMQKNDWSLVSALLAHKLSPDPKSRLAACKILGNEFSHRQEYADSIKYFEEAASLIDPNTNRAELTSINLSLAQQYRLGQRLTESSRAFRSAFTDARTVVVENKEQPSCTAIEGALEDYAKIDPLDAVHTAQELAAVYEAQNRLNESKFLLAGISQIGPPKLRALTYMALGKVDLKARNSKSAQINFDHAIEIVDDGIGKLSLMQLAGSTAFAVKDFGLALRYFQRLVDLSKSLKNPIAENHLRQIANCHFELSDYSSARGQYAESIRLAKTSNKTDPLQVAASLDRLGMCEFHLADYAAAGSSFSSEVKLLSTQLPPDAQLAWAHCHLANTFAKQGLYESADKEFAFALASLDKGSQPGADELRRTITIYRSQAAAEASHKG